MTQSEDTGSAAPRQPETFQIYRWLVFRIPDYWEPPWGDICWRLQRRDRWTVGDL